MIYTSGLGTDEALAREIDNKEMTIILQKRFEIEDLEQLQDKVKRLVRDTTALAKLSYDMQIPKKDLLVAFAGIFPDLFTTRLVKSVRRLYSETDLRRIG